MESESQELHDDDILTAFDFTDDQDYEDGFGTQIPINIGDVEVTDANGPTTETQNNVVDKLASYTHTSSQDDALSNQISTPMVFRLPDSEDVVDVEQYSSKTGDRRTPIKIECEDVTSGDNSVNVIKEENTDSGVEIFWPDLQDHVVDISDSGDEQDVIDVDEDVNIHLKTETVEAPFHWVDMGKGTIDLSESKADGDHTTKVKTEDSDTSFSWALMREHSIEITDSDLDEEVNVTSSTQYDLDTSQTYNFGKSVLRNSDSRLGRRPLDFSKLGEAQQRYAERSRQNPVVTGAGSIFRGLQGQPDKPDSLTGIFAPGLDFDGDEAEKCVVHFSASFVTHVCC